MRVVVSMFDESGNAVRDWARAGYECWCFDLLNENREERESGGRIYYVSADLREESTLRDIVALGPVFLSGFPPCTDLAVSGARHFEAKRAKNPRFQEEAVELCKTVEIVGEAAGCPYYYENPVSLLSTLHRRPDHYFDPCDYGGYLPEDDVHPRYPRHIPARDAYNKKTSLWVGGGFDMPPRRRVQPVIVEYANGMRCSPQAAKVGGSSVETKRIRSETARGFARAVYNHMSERL